MPSPEAARQFLKQFHRKEKLEAARQQRAAEQIAFIPEEGDALSGLGEVNRELVRELGRRCAEQNKMNFAFQQTATCQNTNCLT